MPGYKLVSYTTTEVFLYLVEYCCIGLENALTLSSFRYYLLELRMAYHGNNSGSPTTHSTSLLFPPLIS